MYVCGEMRLTLATIIALLAITVAGAFADEISLTFEAGEYDIYYNEKGEAEIEMEDGFYRSGHAGAPYLPRKTFDVAMPPDIVWKSLELVVTEADASVIDGSYVVEPAPPAVTWRDGQEIVHWGNAGEIVDGKDMAIYGENQLYPTEFAKRFPYCQMRKWKFIKVAFSPIRYNPVSRQLLLAKSITVSLKFSRDPSLLNHAELADFVMDDRAEERFINFEEARSWYPSRDALPVPLDDNYDYVIITTDDHREGSDAESTGQSISDFAQHKTDMGHSVLVVTETKENEADGGWDSKNGDETADKIRQWLVDNWPTMHVKYVLLIGDPRPSRNDVPMKICYPTYFLWWHEQCPTDYYYADLTGKWNKDNDEYYGEYGDDGGDDGVDFEADVYVGRIPVYPNNYAALNKILGKIKTYETTTENIGWRKNVLLSMAFIDSETDKGWLGEYMVQDYLYDWGYNHYRMYQEDGTGCQTELYCDEPLEPGSTLEYWKHEDHRCGLVVMSGHGNFWLMSIGYESASCDKGTLFHRDDCDALGNEYPAFAFMTGCWVGDPEESSNLGYKLLRKGAVSTVSASKDITGLSGDYSPRHDGDCSNIAYWQNLRLTAYKRYPAGEALYITTGTLETDDADWWANYMAFNLYGCPATRYVTDHEGSSSAFYVDGENGSDSNHGSVGSPWKTITHALTSVSGTESEPKIIYVAAGTYASTTNGETFPLDMESYVSLIGEHQDTTILDAEDAAYHVIYCDYVTNLSIRNLTITGGNANGSYPDYYGGGIYCDNSAPRLRDCSISGNAAARDGGGMFNWNSAPTLRNCIISNNTANAGGGIYDYTCDGALINCTISDNTAGAGGGILCAASSPTLTDCTISGNTARDYGGGIYCYHSDPALTTCTISGNTAEDSWGGGICFDYLSNSTLTECNILDNSATEGGGICCYDESSPTLTNCTITSNYAVLGGALYCYEGGSPFIDNNTMSENYACDGGAMYCCESSPIVIENTIEYNRAYLGGGIYCDESPATIQDNNITDNEAYWDGGGIYLGIHNYNDSPTVENNTIDHNSAGWSGGGIFCDWHNYPTWITDNTITNNEAQQEGGGIYCTEDWLTIEINRINNNVATGGAGIYCDNCSPTIEGNEIECNSAYGDGGGIHCYEGSPTIVGNSIFGNCEGNDSSGGGIYCFFSSPWIECNVISNNCTYYQGGGICCYESDPMILANIVHFNWACEGGGIACYGSNSSPTILGNYIWDNDAEYVGGGIYCSYDSSALIQSNDIVGNYVNDYAENGSGGGIHCHESSPTILDNYLWDNEAEYGGGIYCSGSSALIEGNEVAYNHADYGSGICSEGSSPTVADNKISDNEAAICGGGIYCNASTPGIEHCVITDCAAKYGAAMFFEDSSPTILNVLAYGNAASGSGDGGALFSSASSALLTNCTLADNSASGHGGGVYAQNTSTLEILNSILWGNGEEIYDDGSCTITVTYSDVDQDGYESGDNNIRKDPGFVPLDGQNNHTGYYLMHKGPQAKDSACINAGDNTALHYGLHTYTTSTDGTHDDGTVDMGYHYPEGYSGSDNTYIELVSFEARADGSSIVVTWETGTEIDNAGFVIYRAMAGTFDYQQISDLIAAEGTPASGASYTFTDTDVEPGVSYDYWLVDIETSGKWTVHGPASARLPLGQPGKAVLHRQLQSTFAQSYGGQAANTR